MKFKDYLKQTTYVKHMLWKIALGSDPDKRIYGVDWRDDSVTIYYWWLDDKESMDIDKELNPVEYEKIMTIFNN